MEPGGIRSLLLDERGQSVQRGARLSGAFGDPQGLRDPLAAWEAGWWEVPRCRAWQGLAGAGRGWQGWRGEGLDHHGDGFPLGSVPSSSSPPAPGLARGGSMEEW